MINGERQTWYLGSDLGPVETFFYITQWDPYFLQSNNEISPNYERYTTSVAGNGSTYTSIRNIPLDPPGLSDNGAGVLKANAQGYYNRGIFSNITVSPTGNTSTYMYSTAVTSGGAIYAAGEGNITVGGGEQDDTEIFRLSSSLTTIWQRDIDGITQAFCRGMENNNVLWAGSGPATGNTKISLGALDTTGTSVFAKTISASLDVYLNDAATDSDNNVIVSGYLYTPESKQFIIKFNSSGTVLWQNYLSDVEQVTIDVDNENNIYAFGSRLNTSLTPSKLIKFNSSGVHQWTRDIDVTGWDPLIWSNVYITPYSVSVDSTGDIYTAGRALFYTVSGSPPDFIEHGTICKFDSTGNVIFTNAFDFDPNYTFNQPTSTTITDISFRGNAMIFGVTSQKFFSGPPSTSETALFLMSLPINGTLTNSYVIDGNTITYSAWSNITSTAGNAITTTSGNLTVSTFSGAIGPVTTTIWSNLVPDSDTVFLGNVMPEPPAPYTVEYLAVGGGGGTPARIGGGGGGGGVLTGNITLDPGVVYTATVGQGGIGRLGSEDVLDVGAAGSNGNNTVISGTGITTITAIGGGAGGMVNGSGFIYPSTGGSGGGGSTAENGMSGAGAAGTAGQGYAGGTGYAAPVYGGGGGGGAGGVGGNRASSGTASAVGGDGVQSSITGTATYYGGGGGSSSYAGGSGVGGAGGAGGGGTGGNVFASGQNGTDGLGGGGGANGGGDFATSAKGGDGGDGVVIFRILTSNYTGAISGNTTVTTDGSYTVLKFNANGTYTA